MIRIVSGRYGPKLLGPGSVLSLDSCTEERLVKTKIAEYIENKNDDQDNGSDIVFKTIEELQKVNSKKKLINYAESIGLHDLDESEPKDYLVNTIANFIEENHGEE